MPGIPRLVTISRRNVLCLGCVEAPRHILRAGVPGLAVTIAHGEEMLRRVLAVHAEYVSRNYFSRDSVALI